MFHFPSSAYWEEEVIKDAKLRLHRTSFLGIKKWKDTSFYNDSFWTSVQAVCIFLCFSENSCCYMAEGHQSCLQHQPILSYKEVGKIRITSVINKAIAMVGRSQSALKYEGATSAPRELRCLLCLAQTRWVSADMNLASVLHVTSRAQ